MDGKKKNTEITKELRDITPRVDLFSEENPYNPPEGYFQRLPADILANLKAPGESQGPEPEDIPASALPLLFSRRMMRYGIAAITIGIMVLMGWWYFLYPRIEGNGSFVMQERELILDMQPISEAEITDYMESGAVPVLYGSTAEIKDEDMRLMLADISEAELQNYLDKEGTLN